MKPREVIMRALSDPKLRLDAVMNGYAPQCMAIEKALDDAGFVIVPKEPTVEMNCAAVDVFRKNPSAPAMYRAMLNAAR